MDLPGRPPPTTFEFVEAHALREPQRLALVQDNQSWSYEALYLDLVRVTRVLQGLGVQRGDRVAVGMSGFQAGLALLLAAETLGAVTISFLHDGDPDAQDVFSLVGWVFSDMAQSVEAPAKFVPVDAGFIQRVATADVTDRASLPRVSLQLDEVHRISRTSGSSGRAKYMELTRHSQDCRITAALRAGGIGGESRVLITDPLVVNWQFARACGCLRMGAAAMELSRSGLRGHDLTHVSSLPASLEKLLNALPSGFVPRRAITVCTSGGFVTPALRERAARALGGPVLSSFGMNETSNVCDDMDAGGSGVLNPGVDVRIVDAGGQDVPRGQVGVVALRTPAMVDGYLGNPAATEAAFRDGWFFTGDLGALAGPRRLRIVGRHDDLIVAGGVKVPASAVEARIRALVDVQDCAVLATNLDGGRTQLGIALVTGPATSRDHARNAIAGGLDIGATAGARVLFLAQLPRTPAGKLDRATLHGLFAAPPPESIA